MKSLIATVLAGVALTGSAFAQSESEPNDSVAQADTLGSTYPISSNNNTLANAAGTFGTYDDFFIFNVTSGNTYNVQINNNGTFVSPLDVAFFVLNSGQGTVEGPVDNTGDNQNESTTFVAGETGVHYLNVYEATGTQNAISTYSISISESGAASVEDWSIY